ncbi:MAG: hypothetical protein IT326_04895 [Anaerolineae bacterium]|nr:hypothetical protein [Anaerolineae bacterium]
MRVCRQIVLTRETHSDLVAHYEDLDYAMMMPWIDGLTWFDVLQQRDRVTLDQSRALAESMAWVLYGLEYNHLAHCDLSSGNVIVAPDMVQINLIDVEDLYTPWLEPPPYVSTGSMGYQHGESMRSGQWSPTGDRFAGAVLVAEMLGWAHPEVRKRAWGESYFAPDELQKDSDRYTVLVEAIRLYDPGFAEAFEQAWRSRSLESCPPLKTWYDLLDQLPRDPVASWAPIDPALFAPERPEHKRFPGAARRDRGDTPPLTATNPNTMAASAGANPRTGALQRNTRGCRRLAVISGLIFTIACCFLSILAVQVAVINTLSAR